MFKNRYFGLLYLLIFLKLFAVIALITLSGIGLAPDEAQYWTWSQNPAWGYYSKPPGVAWEIWAGCQLFGSTELGVRAGAAVINAWLTLGIYALARASGLTERTAFWSAVVMMFSPLGFMGAIPATTDLGFVLMWTLASALFVRALTKGKTPPFISIGALILVGGLFKWMIFALWPLLLLWVAFYPPARSKKVVVGMLLSLFAFIPTVIWNASHEWATFRHVGNTLLGAVGTIPADDGATRGNFFDFFGAQVGLLSPIYFALLILGIIIACRRWKETPVGIRFCTTTVAILIIYLGLSVADKMQANWAVYIYPAAVVIVAWYASEKIQWGRGRIWLVSGTVLSLLLIAIGVSIPYVQSRGGPIEIPYKFNPFRHSLGWQRLPSVLKIAGYDPSKDFLFGDKYQMTSLLSFYSEGQHRAYFFNLSNTRKNQFSYWPSMADEQIGKTGYFVVAENIPHITGKMQWYQEHYVTVLAPFFDEVEYVGVAPLFVCNGQVAKVSLIFRCKGYNGKEPQAKVSY